VFADEGQGHLLKVVALVDGDTFDSATKVYVHEEKGLKGVGS
jgi:hypothetical protein